jgi:hypothetical protein
MALLKIAFRGAIPPAEEAKPATKRGVLSMLGRVEMTADLIGVNRDWDGGCAEDRFLV